MGMMMPSAPLPPSISGQEMGRVEILRAEERGLARPVKYDLPGIKERMRKRLEEMKEVTILTQHKHIFAEPIWASKNTFLIVSHIKILGILVVSSKNYECFLF